MAMDRDEIIEWLQSLKKGSRVGVDDGGLCLVVEDDHDIAGSPYLEIGGIPNEEEDLAD